ncbi:hypothetical protein GCM10010495_77230 [Kitasatospora herbaricolor]|uniref:DUF4394 domain-containing protein n=1 Tax=Kitasatospora herbaricolor TaxID=68217 RepID=UPI00198A0936|nr:DUF4394 domain-containing protein [Kitasatospora herbaricolor]MDQ0305833.1 hypothetical protein [Kitasatospora herbaricolor]GGV48000.1 hypothetical protein GCM10010495_77230 [Kitasatospora herbaricolor]
MRSTLLAAAVVMAAAAAVVPAHAAVAPEPAQPSNGKVWENLSSVGLTDDQRLVAFPVLHPDRAWTIGKIDGLQGDTRLVGIDYRVQNGLLYGVGDQGGIYTIDDTTGCATKISQLSVALQGTYFGVDFNPAANRLRIVSDTGQNLRHNIDDPNGAPAAGTTAVDGTLTNPAVPPATTGTTATGVTGVAYTNNDLDAATATTLFDVDTSNDRVSLQSPANTGTLAPTGRLGVDAGPDAGFDIYYSPSHGSNHGYATLGVNGTRTFYRVDVLTGQAVALGNFTSDQAVVDIAVPLAQD